MLQPCYEARDRPPALASPGARGTVGSVMCLQLCADLLGLVQTLPALVAIRGRVNSHLPKKCELCDKQAVIHEVRDSKQYS